MVKTYDPECYQLAEHFLQDEPCRNDPALYEKHADNLARHIQQAVEDWFLSPDEGCTAMNTSEPQCTPRTLS